MLALCSQTSANTLFRLRAGSTHCSYNDYHKLSLAPRREKLDCVHTSLLIISSLRRKCEGGKTDVISVLAWLSVQLASIITHRQRFHILLHLWWCRRATPLLNSSQSSNKLNLKDYPRIMQHLNCHYLIWKISHPNNKPTTSTHTRQHNFS